MSPSLLKVLLHFSTVVSAIKDVERGVSDLVHGQPSAADAKAVLGDMLGLITAGFITVPGLTSDQLTSLETEIAGLFSA